MKRPLPPRRFPLALVSFICVSRRAKAEFFHPLEHRMMTARDLVNPELALESLEVIDEGLAARHADESVGEGNVELPGKRRTENESPLRGVGRIVRAARRDAQGGLYDRHPVDPLLEKRIDALVALKIARVRVRSSRPGETRI